MATSAIGGAIDVSGIVSQLMSIERQPLQVLQKSISGIQTKLSAFGKLQGQLSSFQDAARDLLDVDTWKAATGSSSDETAAKASASAGAIPGSYDLTITQLAQRQTLATGTFSDEELMGFLAGFSFTKDAPFPMKNAKVKIETVKDGKYTLATPDWIPVVTDLTKW